MTLSMLLVLSMTATPISHRDGSGARPVVPERSERARQSALAHLRAFAPRASASIQYTSTWKSAYSADVVAEFYTAGLDEVKIQY